MAVTIRLSRAGRIHLPFYHIGVFDRRTRRDGRPIEYLGFYDPEGKKEQVRIDVERARSWLAKGADVSSTVRALLKGQGVAVVADAAKAKVEKAAKTGDKAKAKRAKRAERVKAAAAAQPAEKKEDAKPAKKRGAKKRTASSKAAAERKNKSA